MPNHRRNNKKKNKKKHGSKNRRARKQQNKKTYPNDLNGYVLHPNVPPQKWKQTIEKDGETLYPLPPNYFIKDQWPTITDFKTCDTLKVPPPPPQFGLNFNINDVREKIMSHDEFPDHQIVRAHWQPTEVYFESVVMSCIAWYHSETVAFVSIDYDKEPPFIKIMVYWKPVDDHPDNFAVVTEANFDDEELRTMLKGFIRPIRLNPEMRHIAKLTPHVMKVIWNFIDFEEIVQETRELVYMEVINRRRELSVLFDNISCKSGKPKVVMGPNGPEVVEDTKMQ